MESVRPIVVNFQTICGASVYTVKNAYRPTLYGCATQPLVSHKVARLTDMHYKISSTLYTRSLNVLSCQFRRDYQVPPAIATLISCGMFRQNIRECMYSCTPWVEKVRH